MKKFKVLIMAVVLTMCLGLLVGCGGGGSTNSSGKSSESEVYSQDFKLINATGHEIHGVFLSSVGVDNWEEDVMGQDTLANGASVDISFASDETGQYWDLMVTDDAGAQLIFQNIDLFTVSEVILKIENGAPVAEVK